MDNIEKLNNLSNEIQSSWIEEATEREKNALWLLRSAEIALVLIRELRYKKINQATLAKKMEVSAQYVSKIIKGKENLSLDTICKIEKALGTTLININHPIHLIQNVKKHELIENNYNIGTCKFSSCNKYENVFSIKKGIA